MRRMMMELEAEAPAEELMEVLADVSPPPVDAAATAAAAEDVDTGERGVEKARAVEETAAERPAARSEVRLAVWLMPVPMPALLYQGVDPAAAAAVAAEATSNGALTVVSGGAGGLDALHMSSLAPVCISFEAQRKGTQTKASAQKK